MRGGTGNNIYVIPTPHRLTFGTAMLLAAACCIPASLSLLYLVPQVIRLRKQTRATDVEILDAPIEGTNVTVREMQGVNQIARIFLSVVELPFFMAWLVAILIMGEVNLFSRPVIYQTEPFANVGMYEPDVHDAIRLSC
jgi:hypothetical protein